MSRRPTSLLPLVIPRRTPQPEAADTKADASLAAAIALYEAHQAGAPPDPAAAAWFCTGFQAWLRGKGEFGELMGLPRKAGKAARQRMRDFHLREAWSEVKPARDGRMSRGQALADEIVRFEKSVWPRTQDAVSPDASWSRLRRAVWKARRFGRLPTTWERLDDICNH